MYISIDHTWQLDVNSVDRQGVQYNSPELSSTNRMYMFVTVCVA